MPHAQSGPCGRFAEALRGLTVVARGPKPMAVLREMNVPAIAVPEPNREAVKTTQYVERSRHHFNGARLALKAGE